MPLTRIELCTGGLLLNAWKSNGSWGRSQQCPAATATLRVLMASTRDPLKPFPWSWDEILEHAASKDEYPADLKRQLPGAVAFLRQELGEIDGRPDLADDLRIGRVQVNQAAWTRHWLVWLADTLRRLSTRRSYPALRRRLRSPRGFAEATDVVEVAEVCDASGLETQFDPGVVVRGKERTPDLVVNAPGHAGGLFVEVTTLHDPVGLREADRSMDQVFRALRSSYPIQFAGRCIRVPSQDEIPALAGGFRRVAQRARDSGRVEVLSIDGLVEAAFAADDAAEALRTWATSHGLKSLQFSVPDVDAEESRRVVKALRKKARQLPEDQAGVVVINNQRLQPNLSFGSDGLRDRGEVMTALQALPHVFCLIFCTATWSVAPPTADSIHRPPWIWVAMRRPYELWQFDYEILWNPSFDRLQPRQVLVRVYREFLRRHRYWATRPSPTVS